MLADVGRGGRVHGSNIGDELFIDRCELANVFVVVLFQRHAAHEHSRWSGRWLRFGR